ncbi:PAS domain S-box protein [Scytonema sp. NUACC26]|uniref:sensor histidine kinase n=1 Tax=Scytonema sp. NUACC26 TaxID=3140176 RepID=UPI0034DBCCE5
MDESVKTLHTPTSQLEAFSRLERIAANLPGMIFQFLKRQDGSRTVIYASSGCQELFELEPELVQANFQILYSLAHPQDVNSFEQSVAVSCATGEPWLWEGRIITPSGKLKWVQATSRPEQQPSGDIIWDGLIIDITDRKLAEEKLRESEARYKAILDAIPDLMFRLSRDGVYLDFKGEGANVTIPRHEIIGKHLQDFLPPDVVLLSQKAIAQALDSQSLQTCEYQLPSPQGMRDYEARLVVSGQDEVLTIVRDITNRKQTEVNLRSLAEKFAKVFRASPNPITISTLSEGRFIEVNDSFVEQSGYQRTEAIGRTATELKIWANDRDRIALVQELQKNGVVRNMEAEFRRKSGEVRTGLFSAEIISLDGVQCLLFINHDITERKRAEIALRESEEKFSTAFRCSPNPIAILSLEDGRYVDVNDPFLQITGFRREEVIGRTHNELNLCVNPQDTTIHQTLQQQGFIRNLETEFYDKSGESRVVLFSAEVITLGGERCMLCVTNDITERKQAEDLVRLSAKRDRLLAQTLARIRTSLDLDQILQTTVNEVRQFLEADRVFIALNESSSQSNIIAESVAPKYPSILGWKSDDETLLAELKGLLGSNRLRVVEDITQTTPSTKLKNLYQQFQTRATLAVPIMMGEELFGALIANQCGKPRCWQAMEIDLLQQMSEQVAIAIQQGQLYQQLALLNTDLERQVEERTAQLQQKMVELQELNRVKDVVLHTVSHELQTSVMGNLMVLNNLLGTKDWGLGTGASNIKDISQSLIPVPRSILERMLQGNDRQQKMIESLLELHSSSAHGIVLHQETVPFSILMEGITKNLEPMLLQNQATVKNSIPKGLPLVIADPTKLQKVVHQWFTYSYQHNPPGLRFTLKAVVQDDVIRFTIQDDGVTISKIECDRLFDLYVRDPQARCSTGIGLKMFLCRQIIKAHGGEVGVSSNRKQGLTFWFTLPLVQKGSCPEAEGRRHKSL